MHRPLRYISRFVGPPRVQHCPNARENGGRPLSTDRLPVTILGQYSKYHSSVRHIITCFLFACTEFVGPSQVSQSSMQGTSGSHGKRILRGCQCSEWCLVISGGSSPSPSGEREGRAERREGEKNRYRERGMSLLRVRPRTHGRLLACRVGGGGGAGVTVRTARVKRDKMHVESVVCRAGSSHRTSRQLSRRE